MTFKNQWYFYKVLIICIGGYDVPTKPIYVPTNDVFVQVINAIYDAIK